MTDRVEYELPFGLAGRAARAIFVARILDRIFDHRRQRVDALLGAVVTARPASR